METPSPAQPSAAHVFTWGSLLLNVRHRATRWAGWNWLREENGSQKWENLTSECGGREKLIYFAVSSVNWCVRMRKAGFVGPTESQQTVKMKGVNIIMKAIFCRIVNSFTDLCIKWVCNQSHRVFEKRIYVY